MKKRNKVILVLLIAFMLATTVLTYSILGQIENNDDIFATDFDEDNF